MDNDLSALEECFRGTEIVVKCDAEDWGGKCTYIGLGQYL